MVLSERRGDFMNFCKFPKIQILRFNRALTLSVLDLIISYYMYVCEGLYLYVHICYILGMYTYGI